MVPPHDKEIPDEVFDVSYRLYFPVLEKIS